MNTKLKIQKKFTDRQRKICKVFYNLLEDETIIFIWWIHPFKKQGFVFTDKRVLWNLPTKISGENDIEIYHQETGEIFFDSKMFLEITAENSELIIHTQEKRYSFENKKYSLPFLIDKIFKDYFDKMTSPADEYCTFNNSFILEIEGLLQNFSIPDSGENKVYKVFDRGKKGGGKIKYTALKTASFIRHFFDFILDIYSFLVLSFCFLINATVANPILENYFKEIKEIPSKGNFLLWMIIISCVYFILKLLVVLTTKNVKKLPPVLIVTVQILVWLIANEKYPFLLIINFLLIYIFQRVCNFSKNSIRLKFTLYFEILIAVYLCMTFIL